VQESYHRDYLKIGDIEFLRLNGFEYHCRKLDQVFLSNQLRVHANSLPEGWDVGRDKESGFVTCMFQCPRSLYSHCAFTIGPSHMHCLKLVLRISERSCEVPHLIDVGFLPWAEFSIHVPFEDPL
jgi:hypothetical protein